MKSSDEGLEAGVQLLIRAVREDDAESIVELLNPIIRAGVHTIMTEAITVADQLGFIRSLPERGIFHVAVAADRQSDGQTVLGIQDVQPVSVEPALEHVGAISTFVPMATQRRGVGRRLCEATVDEARDRGFRKIMATVRSDNGDAVAFYRSQSFAVIGTARQHAFVRGRYIDEVLLERVL